MLEDIFKHFETLIIDNVMYLIICFYVNRDNYTKPTCGLGENHFAYPWFEKYHLTHLRYDPFVFRNPPLLKSGVNRYFFLKFYISLLPKQKIAQKCKRNKIKK